MRGTGQTSCHGVYPPGARFDEAQQHCLYTPGEQRHQRGKKSKDGHRGHRWRDEDVCHHRDHRDTLSHCRDERHRHRVGGDSHAYRPSEQVWGPPVGQGPIDQRVDGDDARSSRDRKGEASLTGEVRVPEHQCDHSHTEPVSGVDAGGAHHGE